MTADDEPGKDAGDAPEDAKDKADSDGAEDKSGDGNGNGTGGKGDDKSGDGADGKGDDKPKQPDKPPLYKRPLFLVIAGVVLLVLIVGGCSTGCMRANMSRPTMRSSMRTSSGCRPRSRAG